MKYLLCLILFFSLFFGEILGGTSFAQNRSIDSLLTLLKTDKPDTNKVIHLYRLSGEYIKIGLFDTSIHYGNSALKLAQQLNFKKGIASSFNNIGIAYAIQGNYPEALKNNFAALKIYEGIGAKQDHAATYNNTGLIYSKQGNFPEALKSQFAALKIYQDIKDKQGISAVYNCIGVIYWRKANYPEALKNYYAALKIMEEIGDKDGIATSYNNIGIIYKKQRNYNEALKNHFASLKIKEEVGDKQGIASSYNNIGNIYIEQGNYTAALKEHLASLKIKEEIGDKQGIATSYGNIGIIYEHQGNYPEALKNLFDALKISEDIGDKHFSGRNLFTLGEVYTKLNKLKEAKDYLNKALQLSKEIGAKETIKDSYNGLATLDSIQGNWKAAYYHHKLYILYRDSIDNEETRKKTIESTMNYEFEKKELATQVEQEKKDANAAAENNKQKIIRNTFISGFVLMLLFGIIIGREYRQKHIANNQLKEKNRIIAEQKLLVEEKNKDISDSVSYAKRIQSSFLTSEAYIRKYLPEYFILYKPRDIVSGDFYWFHQQNDHMYFCIADCTGHGIPGAFMSLIGMGVLNEIIYSKQMKETSTIVDELRRIVILAVNPEGTIVEGKDGMDLVLGRLHLQTKELQYSAANNSFYVYRNGELIKHKPDKMPVGKFGDFEKPFTQHTIQLTTGDIIYAGTDGFIDQFGGAKRKKYMSKRFEEYLTSIAQNSLEEQKEMLDKEFLDWKGNLNQIDDVTVVGIRL